MFGCWENHGKENKIWEHKFLVVLVFRNWNFKTQLSSVVVENSVGLKLYIYIYVPRFLSNQTE